MDYMPHVYYRGKFHGAMSSYSGFDFYQQFLQEPSKKKKKKKETPQKTAFFMPASCPRLLACSSRPLCETSANNPSVARLDVNGATAKPSVNAGSRQNDITNKAANHGSPVETFNFSFLEGLHASSYAHSKLGS